MTGTHGRRCPLSSAVCVEQQLAAEGPVCRGIDNGTLNGEASTPLGVLDGWGAPVCPPHPQRGVSGHRQLLAHWLPCCGSCDQAAGHTLPVGLGLGPGLQESPGRAGHMVTSEASWHRNAPAPSPQGVSVAATERWPQSAERPARSHEARAGAEEPERRGLGWLPPKQPSKAEPPGRRRPGSRDQVTSISGTTNRCAPWGGAKGSLQRPAEAAWPSHPAGDARGSPMHRNKAVLSWGRGRGPGCRWVSPRPERPHRTETHAESLPCGQSPRAPGGRCPGTAEPPENPRRARHRPQTGGARPRGAPGRAGGESSARGDGEEMEK